MSVRSIASTFSRGLFARSLALHNFGKEGNIKFVSVSVQDGEQFRAQTEMVNKHFADQLASGGERQITSEQAKMFNLGIMEGMSKEEAKTAVSAALADIQDTNPHKYFRADPTRYGDWEKNGICYDF